MDMIFLFKEYVVENKCRGEEIFEESKSNRGYCKWLCIEYLMSDVTRLADLFILR